MSKYLELVGGSLTQEHLDKQQNQKPYVAYSIKDNNFIYSIVPKEDGDEFTGYGYVDLGLSVMWSEYNIGADSPEQMGNLFEWRGSVSGDKDYELSLDKDPVYQTSTSDIRKFTPRTPTVAQVKELLKCNKVEETLNGVPGTRFTADNGNSIFIPENDYWTPVTSTASTYITTKATSWSPSKGIQDNATLKTVKLPFRGVCSNLPKDNAILLEYDKQILVVDDRLYCFPKTWSSTVFKTSTGNTVKMYASPSTQFSIESSNGVTRRIYTYGIENGERVLYMSDKEMNTITSLATDDYIYVRFACDASTAITPSEWSASECASQSTRISPNIGAFVYARGSNNIYRINYADFAGYGLTINWSGNSTLPIYISDTCSYTLSSTNPHVLLYSTIKRNGSLDVDAATVDSWASRVSEEGFLYVRFNPTNQGAVTFVTDNPVV
jgi:hypothetical protein